MSDRIQDRQSLKDLDGVRVEIEDPLPPGVAGDTLTREIEARLRAADVRVLRRGEFPTGDPRLRVSVSISAARVDLVAVHAQLDFVQTVFMRRNPLVTFNRAQTWRADARVLLVQVSRLEREVAAELARQVGQFVEDYRAANA